MGGRGINMAAETVYPARSTGETQEAQPETPRRIACPAEYAREIKWFAEPYFRPGMPSDDEVDEIRQQMHAFQDLIWNNGPSVMLQEFGATPDELAHLCGEGSDGWLMSNHIMWILDKVNASQSTTFCCFLNALTTSDLLHQQQTGSGVWRISAVINVGRNANGSVFVASPTKSGSHWTLAVVDIQDQTITYCDTLAWACPHDLWQLLSPVLQVFNIGNLRDFKLSTAHEPTPLGSNHVCKKNCLKYPFQQCGNVCGIVSLICAVLSALDVNTFRTLLDPKTKATFLHQPTRFEKYLRRILIGWFVTGTVSVSFMEQAGRLRSFRFSSETSKQSSSSRKRFAQKKRNSIGCKKSLNQTSIHHTESSVSSNSRENRQTTHKPNANNRRLFNNNHQNYHSKTKKCSTKTNVHDKWDPDNKTENIEKPDTSQTDSDPVSRDEIISNREESAISESQSEPASKCDKESDGQIDHTYHRNSEMSSAYSDRKMSSNSRECPFCSMTLHSRFSLVRHLKRKHPGNKVAPKVKGTYQCFICEQCCVTVHDLIRHYNSVHDKNIEIETKNFPNREEFEKWRKKVLKEDHSQFTKQRGGRADCSKYVVHYYSCNRSGTPRTIKDRKRALKTQGSVKFGGKCTAYMTVFCHNDSEKVRAEYCLQHVGHEQKLCHLKLSSDLRNKIAAKLTDGVQPRQILDDVRASITDNDRDALVTLRDINNIQKQLNILNSQKQVSDQIGVDLWAEEFRHGLDDPFICLKPEGAMQNGFTAEDFLLCIQTPFQKEMFRMHATKLVCLELTYSITQYDFMLITVLIFDDFGEAIPVAWAISSREDMEFLKIFMAALKEANDGKDYCANAFMSDLSNNLYNAWCEVFPKPNNRLFPAWHIEWRKKSLELVKSGKQQNTIFTYLKALQVQTDEGAFRGTLQELLDYLKNECIPLYNYFFHNYIKEDEFVYWTTYFLQGACANTNKFLDAYRRVLKDIYFNKKQNRRLDDLLEVLLKLSKDMSVEQVIKVEKGKITHKTREIRTQHKNAEEVSGIKYGGVENEWLVPASQTDGSQYYFVRKVATYEQCHCKLVCADCGVCIHMFTCECLDFLTKAISCKHIHAVQIMHNIMAGSEQTSEHTDESGNLTFIYETFSCQEEVEVSADNFQRQESVLINETELLDLVSSAENIEMVYSSILTPQ